MALIVGWYARLVDTGITASPGCNIACTLSRPISIPGTARVPFWNLGTGVAMILARLAAAKTDAKIKAAGIASAGLNVKALINAALKSRVA